MITIIMLVVVVGMKMLVIMLIMVLLYEKQNNVDIPTLKKSTPLARELCAKHNVPY
jgi:flagellar basal body-associated protein FliL